MKNPDTPSCHYQRSHRIALLKKGIITTIPKSIKRPLRNVSYGMFSQWVNRSQKIQQIQTLAQIIRCVKITCLYGNKKRYRNYISINESDLTSISPATFDTQAWALRNIRFRFWTISSNQTTPLYHSDLACKNRLSQTSTKNRQTHVCRIRQW